MLGDEVTIEKVTALVVALTALVGAFGKLIAMVRARNKALRTVVGAVEFAPMPDPMETHDDVTGEVIVDYAEHGREKIKNTVRDATVGLKIGSLVQRALADAKARKEAEDAEAGQVAGD